MIDKVSVVIPTLGKPHAKICERFLSCIPFPFEVIWSKEGTTWPQAVNAGLSKTDKKRDVILMDDDIFLMPNTFMTMLEYYDKADIFGFKLLFPDGTIQHAGGIFKDGNVGHRFFMEDDNGQADTPVYVPHVTTSLIYIKRHVLDKLHGMATDYQGMQMEDVDFCLRAVKEGFRILYVPAPAVHLESATKKHMPQFRIQMSINMIEIKRRFMTEAFKKELESYPKPYVV